MPRIIHPTMRRAYKALATERSRFRQTRLGLYREYIWLPVHADPVLRRQMDEQIERLLTQHSRDILRAVRQPTCPRLRLGGGKDSQFRRPLRTCYSSPGLKMNQRKKVKPMVCGKYPHTREG
jgi:hypothetical protein